MQIHSATIELATTDDAEAIVTIRRQTWLDTYPNQEAGITREDLELQLAGRHGEQIPERVERWRRRIASPAPNTAVFVARLGRQAVGYAAPIIIDGQRRVGALYVLPEAQGRGAGSQLLQRTIAWHHQHAPTEPIFLHVAKYNHKAMHFYKKFGFQKTDREVSDDIAKLPGGKIIPEIEMVLKN